MILDAPHTRGDDPSCIRKTLSCILLFVGILLMVAAASVFFYQRYQYWKQDSDLGELQTFVSMAAPQEEPISDSDFVANDTTVVSHAPVVDWDGLHAISSDIVAWIHIPDTVVNYPVLHGRSNEEYLRADANHNYAIGGSIFIDAENTPPCMIDNQTIVYGHRMSNGSMFNFVSQMSAQDVFSTVETIWYVTEEKTYELAPLFIYQAAPSGDDVLWRPLLSK